MNINQHRPVGLSSWGAEFPAGPEPTAAGLPSRPEGGQITFVEILAIARGSALKLGTWVAVCAGVAALYLAFAPAEYVAVTQIVLEAHRPAGTATDAAAAGAAPVLDSAQADSEVEVVRSERNLRFVFDTLNIQQDPSFAHEPLGLVPRLLRLLPARKDDGTISPAERAERAKIAAFEAFRNRVDVRRIGGSYILETSFRAPSATEAMRLANAVTAAYIRGQIDMRATSVGRGTEYLQERIADIKAQQQAATDAVRLGTIPDMQFADADARVVGAAVAPLYKSFPQSKLIILFAVAAGLFSGIALIVARHSFNRRIRSRLHFKRALGFDCLGVLPRLRTGKSHVLQAHDILSMEAHDPVDARFARAIRDLRTAIVSAEPTLAPLSLGIVSCSPGEGRSVVAANLAFLFAASGSPVVLIDGDLRNPSLTRIFAPDGQSSLSQMLSDPAPDPRLPVIAIKPNLDFVPAVGTGEKADPNIFIGSGRMQKALAEIKGRQTVLLDLSPLQATSDALAFGALLDGVVLCAEVNRTTVDALAEALRAFAAAHTRVVGVVLTRMPTSGR